MILRLKTGIENKITKTVRQEDLATVFGSEHLPVLATSKIVAFMEYTALSSIQTLLPDGYTSVGTKIDLEHYRPAVIDTEVTCFSRLTDIEGRKIIFELTLRSNTGILSKATHERAVVNEEAFKKRIDIK